MKPAYRPILPHQFKTLPNIQRLGAEWLRDCEVVSRVLPFKINGYVVDQLIDWQNLPDDPIFQLTFPHREMLPAVRFRELRASLDRGAAEAEVEALIARIRDELNPHPAEQVTKNTPALDEQPIPGLQHKYRETVLFFPRAGQTCHAYCSFCFRWPQFVDGGSLRIALADAGLLAAYLERHREISDLLVTGGDPMTMTTRRLAVYLDCLLDPKLEHVQNVRFGTKALSFWPYRFTEGEDADELMRFIERLVEAGKHVAIMAHVNHPVELSTPAVQSAIRRLRSAGAQIRSQSPVLRHVNDDAGVWSGMWKEQVRLGVHPYYMFVARDTGAKSRYDIPLARALEIYQHAIRGVSGLARTARGPSMSASSGKVEIKGVIDVAGRKAFVLNYLQARDADRVGRPFLARYDERATWFDQLRPFDDAARELFEHAPSYSDHTARATGT
jgi:KamA family protein